MAKRIRHAPDDIYRRLPTKSVNRRPLTEGYAKVHYRRYFELFLTYEGSWSAGDHTGELNDDVELDLSSEIGTIVVPAGRRLVCSIGVQAIGPTGIVAPFVVKSWRVYMFAQRDGDPAFVPSRHWTQGEWVSWYLTANASFYVVQSYSDDVTMQIIGELEIYEIDN